MTDTPVTKLDSVERLTEKYCTPKITVYGGGTYATREQLTAALTEMWDLSRREGTWVRGWREVLLILLGWKVAWPI
jgi:hypothetical protein